MRHLANVLFTVAVAVILWVVIRKRRLVIKTESVQDPTKSEQDPINQVETKVANFNNTDILQRKLTDEEREKIEKRIRISEQTKKAFEHKPKQEIQINSENLLPPGQRLSKKWIVLDLGLRPEHFDLDSWKLTLVDASTQRSLQLSLDQIKALGAKKFKTQFHCYTGWTVVDLEMTGTPFQRLIEHFSPSPTWSSLFQVSADGYTTSAPRPDFERDDVYLAWAWNDHPLPTDHGIIRLINPSLYGSKSGKFLSEIHFLSEPMKGFWEQRGVHHRGNVMKEERFDRKSREVTGLDEARRLIGICKDECAIELDLSGLNLDEVPDEVFTLTSLRSLLLHNNNLTTIPEKIKLISKLTLLSLNTNRFSEIPASIGQLPKLQELWFNDNQVTAIPEAIFNLKKLAVLGVEHNRIEVAPRELGNMPNLSAIFADGNRIRELPAEWAEKTWGALLFSGNPIEYVPTEYHKLKTIRFLGFFGCPAIPKEVLEDGTPGILKFLEAEHLKKLSQ